MKTMKMPSRHAFRLFAALSLASTAMTMLVGCPAGTKTSVEAGVTAVIDPANCKEAKEDKGGTSVLLDCTTVTGTGIIRIEFPRKGWFDIKLSHSGVDAGPGK
jgi:hypothetical protein